MLRSSFKIYPHIKYAAFSLLEISIVIVIISLLIGSVTVGTSLYDNYKLMTIVSDVERYRSAIKNFKDQYQYWPGDFARATAIWTQTSSPVCTAATGTSSTSVVSTTCNGKGDGRIGLTGSDMQEMRERFFLWQHLNLAGYVDERYSGFSSTAGQDTYISPGVNVPRLRYDKNLGYTLYYNGTNNLAFNTAAALPVQGNMGHIFSWSTPNIGIATSSLINAVDAAKIDTKIDDGMPFTGDVFGDGTITACFSSSNYSTSNANTCGQYLRNFLEK